MRQMIKAVLAGACILLLSAAASQSESAFRFVVWGDATDLLEHVVILTGGAAVTSPAAGSGNRQFHRAIAIP